MDTYERKYNEAVLRADEAVQNGCLDKDIFDIIFPPEESEDERMIKWIIKVLDEGYKAFFEMDYSKEDVLSWLEKQKEQKELPLMDGNTDLYFDEWNQQKQNPTKRQCFEEGIRYAQRLQKEQKPIQTDAEKEYVRTLKSLVADFVRANNYIERGYYQQIYDWLDGRHVEQKEQSVPKDLDVVPPRGITDHWKIKIVNYREGEE